MINGWNTTNDQLMLLQLTKGKADSDIYKRFGYCIWNR